MEVVRREGYQFCQELLVPCYQTDERTVLRPASFMDMAQEIAYWAAQELGFGYDTLHIHHKAWVLSRMHIRFLAPPRWRDAVKLYTWHKGTSGLFYLRDFVLLGPQGETAVTCTSSWVVIDEQSRHLVRPEEFQELLQVGEVADAIKEPAPKVSVPAKAGDAPVSLPEPAGEHRVAFSDLDIVGHTNNARYVVWAMDCLPLDVANQSLKDLIINFNKECLPGERVQLYRLHAGNAWYVEGRVDGKSCFTVKMEY